MKKRILNKIDFKCVIENDYELPLYKEVTLKVMQYLESNNNPVTFEDIIKNVKGNDRRTLRLLHQMVQLNLIGFKNSKFYSFKKNKNNIAQKEVVCPYCDSKIVNIKGKLTEITKMMKKIYEEKPRPTFVFDQRPVNYETTVRRVAYLIWRGDIQDKKIAILGDDDLTSLAIGLAGLAKEVVIFEIDQRLVKFIRKKSKEQGLNIKVVLQDLTKDIPKQYQNYFDVFMADPTPTKVPFTVFTNKGIHMLKKGETSVGYTSFYPSCMKLNLDLQRILTKMNLVITDIIPFFTQYDFVKETYSPKDLELLKFYGSKESKISFYEHLVRVEVTKETKTVEQKYKLEELIGSATKRVLNHPEKDPTLSSKSIKDNKKYVEKFARKLRKGICKWMVSK